MRSESDAELSRSDFQAYGSFHSSTPQDRRRYGRRKNQWAREDDEGSGERRESMLHRAAVPVGIMLLLGIAILAAHSIWTITTHPQEEPELTAQHPHQANMEVSCVDEHSVSANDISMQRVGRFSIGRLGNDSKPTT